MISDFYYNTTTLIVWSGSLKSFFFYAHLFFSFFLKKKMYCSNISRESRLFLNKIQTKMVFENTVEIVFFKNINFF